MITRRECALGARRLDWREFLGGARTRPGEANEPEWGSSTTVNDAIEAWKANGWADLSPTNVDPSWRRGSQLLT